MKPATGDYAEAAPGLTITKSRVPSPRIVFATVSDGLDTQTMLDENGIRSAAEISSVGHQLQCG